MTVIYPFVPSCEVYKPDTILIEVQALRLFGLQDRIWAIYKAM